MVERDAIREAVSGEKRPLLEDIPRVVAPWQRARLEDRFLSHHEHEAPEPRPSDLLFARLDASHGALAGAGPKRELPLSETVLVASGSNERSRSHDAVYGIRGEAASRPVRGPASWT